MRGLTVVLGVCDMEKREPRKHEMKFADKHIYRILRGHKTSTYRYDDYEDVSEGDSLIIQDVSGKDVARATVTASRPIAVRDIPEEVLEGHSSYETPEDALNDLAGYYPQKDLNLDSEFVVVVWELEEVLL